MWSFGVEGGRSSKDHIGLQGGGQDGPKKDHIIFERSLIWLHRTHNVKNVFLKSEKHLFPLAAYKDFLWQTLWTWNIWQRVYISRSFYQGMEFWLTCPPLYKEEVPPSQNLNGQTWRGCKTKANPFKRPRICLMVSLQTEETLVNNFLWKIVER